MTGWARFAIIALAVAIGAGGAASAGAPEPRALLPAEGVSVALGPVNGVVYYSSEATGDRIVATLAGADGGTPMRVVAVLTPGQSITLSVPRGRGEPAIEVAFIRRGDRVFVSQPPPLTN